MLEAKSVISNNTTLKTQATITLPFDQRHKRRCLMKADSGEEFLLNLQQTVILQDGDILELSDGRLISVKAADEDVLDLHSEEADTLIKLSWTLGNMHFPIEIRSSSIRVRYDHVLEHDLKSFGMKFIRHQAPFTPLVMAQKHNND